MVILLILRLKSVFIWKAKGKDIKLSVISSSALQFNLLILVFSVQSSFGNNLSFDQALFRLSGQAFFLSDVIETQKAFKSFKCLSRESFLSVFLEQDISFLTSLKTHEVKKQKVLIKKESLKPFILLEKLKNSALGKGRESLSKNELMALNRNCNKVSWKKLTINEKALYLSEVYLRDRFSSSDNPKLALVEFRKSINAKESHEVFKIHSSKGVDNVEKSRLVPSIKNSKTNSSLKEMSKSGKP